MADGPADVSSADTLISVSIDCLSCDAKIQCLCCALFFRTLFISLENESVKEETRNKARTDYNPTKN